MIRFVAILGLSLFFSSFFASEAFAAPECGKRDKVIEFLQNKYKERLVAGGIVNNQQYMEFFASKDGKSWTILITGVTGISCVLAAGQAYYKTKPKTVKDPRA